MIVSIALIGALVGSLVSGVLSDKYGRKLAIFTSDIFFISGSLIMYFCNSFL